ncbi:hypothetical protein SAMN06265360_107162 [Haloechinothrix alba]|uniref:Uncharacterized protein n=1 Tax=Haloechinothrix alba TaxID=664784 RepID=A0A238WSB1_9PSEU|nr:hypothetical protein SAMN06265360_107162 [Haloechinothrix alba]
MTYVSTEHVPDIDDSVGGWPEKSSAGGVCWIG